MTVRTTRSIWAASALSHCLSSTMTAWLVVSVREQDVDVSRRLQDLKLDSRAGVGRNSRIAQHEVRCA
jgi:hypothetical protein